tara:strand:+ start:374 stop:568 length:195 start_codon:yes stop_codon:yes gene_type:complete
MIHNFYPSSLIFIIMRKEFLNIEDNNFLLMTFYFPEYAYMAEGKVNQKKCPRKYKLIKKGIKYL